MWKIPCPPFDKRSPGLDCGKTQIMRFSRMIKMMSVVTPNGRKRRGAAYPILRLTIQIVFSVLPHYWLYQPCFQCHVHYCVCDCTLHQYSWYFLMLTLLFKTGEETRLFSWLLEESWEVKGRSISDWAGLLLQFYLHFLCLWCSLRSDSAEGTYANTSLWVWSLSHIHVKSYILPIVLWHRM